MVMKSPWTSLEEQRGCARVYSAFISTAFHLFQGLHRAPGPSMAQHSKSKPAMTATCLQRGWKLPQGQELLPVSLQERMRAAPVVTGLEFLLILRSSSNVKEGRGEARASPRRDVQPARLPTFTTGFLPFRHSAFFLLYKLKQKTKQNNKRKPKHLLSTYCLPTSILKPLCDLT